MNECVDQDLAHGVGRDERTIHSLQASWLDASRQREMSLADKLRFLEQLECWTAHVPLVEKLGLVGVAEASHPQLALRVVRQEVLPKSTTAARQSRAAPFTDEAYVLRALDLRERQSDGETRMISIPHEAPR